MTMNKPNRLVLDAFSDPQLAFSSTYSGFTNRFPSALYGAKSIDVVSVSFVNTTLQLNDVSQLFFWYYASSTQAGIVNPSNLKCVRLLPSDYVPNVGFTAFTRNKYFNSVEELVASLNSASATGGDFITSNPYWLANGVLFSYDSSTRRISVASGIAGNYIAPAGYDDPNIASALATNPITQYGYAGAVVRQPYIANETMNQRLGFTQGQNARGQWFDSTNGQIGVATSTGVPQLFGTLIPPSTTPILLGSQFVGVYLDIIPNGGYEPQRRNLLANIPIDSPSLNVITYLPSATTTIKNPPETIDSVSVLLIDDHGVPFTQPASYNVRVELSIGY